MRTVAQIWENKLGPGSPDLESFLYLIDTVEIGGNPRAGVASETQIGSRRGTSRRLAKLSPGAAGNATRATRANSACFLSERAFPDSCSGSSRSIPRPSPGQAASFPTIVVCPSFYSLNVLISKTETKNSTFETACFGLEDPRHIPQQK